MSDTNEITLDSLMQEPIRDQSDIDTQALAVKAEETPARLSPEERARVDALKDAIDLRDSQSLAVYGSDTQKGVAQFSAQILSEVKSKDAGDVGEMMSDLMLNVKDLDFSSLEGESFMDKLSFVKKTKRSIEKFIARYEVVESHVDKIQAQLESARMELLKDIGVFDKLYDKNVDYFRELQYYILAGEEKIAECRENVLPKLYEDAKNADDPMAMQVVKDFDDAVNRFEKKIFDLKTSKTVAIQTAPQIKLIQNNDKLLVDKVTDAITNTIPLWKSQMVIALGTQKQGQVLAMQKQVSDTTNELLRKNAEKLKQTTLDVAEEAERSTIDVETLQKVNDELIATIEDSIKIHDRARENRAKAEVELEKIENSLKAALENASRPKLEA
ncbi:toxic anion resistance protein [Aedoeadaptatus urinae]|uniref:toxic anion resistance protein n=1 Tax=Aedoeadaptatus urinae TaxID=1871017 RepID=UPI00097D5C95|nr:toxic anion resistance protein [Peptoniphilus urinae]